MLRQTSTSAMVGRAAELASLQDAFRACLSGTPQWVLISGEAGLGKTRLLHAFVDGLQGEGSTEAPVVAVGQCVDLGAAGAPFGPVKEILRGLARQLGLDAVAEAAAWGRPVLATLLPDLGDKLPGDADELTGAVAQLLESLSAVRPLVLVVEDVHWADAATIALLRELRRAVSTGAVVTVISYRTEEADRAHPVRPLLVDLARDSDVTAIPLQRLTLDQVAEQAAALLGTRPDQRTVQRLFRRSEGVPFFVEELTHWGVDEEELPDTVRDLMLARYDRLDPAAQQVLRLAAVGGVRVPHEILAAVFDGDPTDLDRVARDAVTATVLMRDRDSYVFRHALLRDGVQDELMPGERSRYHTRYAEVLSEHPTGRWAEIAHHWLAAHEVRNAFSATIAALAETDGEAAPASAAALARQAADLWPQVPDAEEVAGTDRIGQLISLFHLLIASGDLDGAGAAADEALALGTSDASRHAELLHLKYIVVTSIGEVADQEPLRQALATMPEPTTDEQHLRRASVVGSLALDAMLAGDYAEAARGCEQAAVEALAAGDRAEAARALVYLGFTRAAQGDVDGAREAFDRAATLDPSPLGIGCLAYFAGLVWTWLGEYSAAVEVAERAFSRGRETGAVRFFGQGIFAFVAEAWLGLGDPDAAAVAIAEGSRLGPRVSADRTRVSIQEVLFDVWRDDLPSAEDLLLAVAPLAARWASDSWPLCGTFAAAAELELARNAPDRAWAEVARWLDSSLAAPGLDLRLLALGAAALGLSRRRGIAPDGDAEQRLRVRLAERSVWPVARSWAAVVDAELSGPGRDGTDADAWRAAVAAAEDGRLGADKRVYTRLRLAEALLGIEDRSGAGKLLAEARDLATRYQALRRLREIDHLAARAGLSNGDRPSRNHDPNHLTAREAQVLELIAEGLSNGQIGERLFISTKTASVHVSAILRKLGVSGRTEAALIAERSRRT